MSTQTSSTDGAPVAGRSTASPGLPGAADAQMTHREILQALSGLLLGLFVAILSSTVVSNALPRIISDLHGSQSGYTWVVTSTLLATTASTPIWGKLSDLFSKKLLVQLSLIVFVVGSAAAGLSQSIGPLIAARVVQGLGAGGLTALTQVCMAAMIPPRERGRYSGYLGAVLAVATVAGPLIGGVIVDTSWLGWRWCFYVGVPFAAAAIVLLQKTLHLRTIRRENVKIDWLGATLITGSVSLLLIWVSLAGNNYDWWSWQTVVMVLGAVALGALAVFVESRAAEPVIPLSLFRHRSISLAVAASLFVGIALFGATVFLSQYFQISRGDSPTQAGLSTTPLILGLFVSSLVSGRIITRTGKWKRFLVAGAALITLGFAAMGTLSWDTPYWQLACYMAVIGLGLGMTMQNLVLSVQNAVPMSQLGAASSTVAFFRSLGGAVGVAVLGAVLAHQVSSHIASGLASLGVSAGASGGASQIPDISTLPAPVAQVVQESYGIGAGDIFLVAAPITFLALVAVLFIKEVPLRTSNDAPDQLRDTGMAGSLSEGAAVVELGGGTAETGSVAADPAPPEHGGGRSGGATSNGATANGATANGATANGATSNGATANGSASDGASSNGVALNGAASNGGAVNGGAVNGATVNGAASAGVPRNGRSRRFSNQAVLSGTVHTGDDTPVVSASVTVLAAAGGQIARAATDAGGQYRVTLPTGGSFLLVVNAAGHRPAVTAVTVADGRLERDFQLDAVGSLGGLVRTTSGRPRGGVTITVIDARGDVAAVAVTGPTGRYELADLQPGDYTLTAIVGDANPAAYGVHIPHHGRADFDVELPENGSLRGTVRGRDADLPVPHAAVAVLDRAGMVVHAVRADEFGRYEIDALTPGEYTVVASGYGPVVRSVTVAPVQDQTFDVTLGHDPDPDGGAMPAGRHARIDSVAGGMLR